MSDLPKPPHKSQTGVEKALLAIWSQALGAQNIKDSDNFFELGGTTSLALHLAEQIRSYLGLEISSNAIVENPTVKGLAQRLESARQSSVKDIIPSHSQEYERHASFAQVRHYLQYKLEPDDSAASHIDVYRLHGRLDQKALEQAVLALLQRHESLRTIFYFDEEKGKLLQKVVEAPPAITYDTLESYSGPEQELRLRQLIQVEAERPFVLEVGPLFRSLLIALSPDVHVLALIAHHIVADEWSQQIMISDLLQLYHAIAKGMPSPLPELKMQYWSFATWQRERIRKVGDKANVLEEVLHGSGSGDHSALTPVEKTLVEIWSKVLGVSKVGVHDNFFKIGGNSLLAISAAARARKHGLHFSGRDIFRHQVISGLAKVIRQVQPDVGEVVSESRNWWPTVPSQRSFFDRNTVNPSLWNIAMLLKVSGTVNPENMRLAAKQLLNRHPSLLLQFRRLDGEWVQYLAEPGADLFSTFDLSQLDHATQLKELTRIGNQLNSSFKFGEGTLVRFALFHLGEQGARFFIVVHHLVSDGLSTQILYRDLPQIYASLGTPGQPEDRKKTGPFLEWVLHVHSQPALAQAIAEQSYWAQRRPVDVPVDFPNGKNLVSTAHRLQIQLSKEESAALMMQAHKKYQTSIDVLLLWALSVSMMEWQKRQFVVVTMIGHGRESQWSSMDLSGAVGFFAGPYPLVIEIPADAQPEAGVSLVRSQTEAVPNHGIGYGILRFIHNRKTASLKIPLQEEGDVSFNYLGNRDVLYEQNEVFTIAREDTGARLDPRAEGPYKLGFFCFIAEGKIQGDWWFNLGFYKLETMETFTAALQRNLRRLL